MNDAKQDSVSGRSVSALSDGLDPLLPEREYSPAAVRERLAAERERCAVVCDDYAKHMLAVYQAKGQQSALDEATGAVACASGIRA